MKAFLLTLVLTFSIGLVFSQDTSTTDSTASKSEITFESLVYDYGTIKQNADGNCEFKFKNTGKEALVLTNVKASCGCTTPSWPKEPIQKGEKNTIKVKYDTKRVGSFTKSITITSNAKNSPIRLTIKGKVEKVEAAPAETK